MIIPAVFDMKAKLQVYDYMLSSNNLWNINEHCMQTLNRRALPALYNKM
jgi:hypothetical protein